MDSRTVGMGTAYGLEVHNALRLTSSGTYVHQAEWAETTIVEANTSHGCIGMRAADAEWSFQQANVGDVLEVTGGTETVNAGNGFGDWNIAWADWLNRTR
ncbi:L,D-transpeptidase [Streptomyces sp. NPDC008343]|uniref:L,D-transpeptidase n=1 Tax=Streptomyces sp. NPDC008343 TaxID=3364828 RepID=UPI0036E96710